jgi:hypothetical protein
MRQVVADFREILFGEDFHPLVIGSPGHAADFSIRYLFAQEIKSRKRRNEGIRSPEADPRIPHPEADLPLRNNSGAFKREDGHFYRFGALGSPDIVCVIKGQFVGIEVKAPKGKQSEHQKEFQRNLEADGGKYVLAYSLEDVITFCDYNVGMAKTQKCFHSGCALETQILKVVELVPTPFGMPQTDLKRTPPFGEQMRTFRVSCPVHGEGFVQEVGHHISTIPKKKSKKKH